MLEDSQLKDLADEQGTSIATVRTVLLALREQLGADRFYIFWVAGAGAAGSGARRERTLLAFRTADAALAFAQRNQLAGAASRPRLRRLSILQLVQAMLREPAITALLFVDDEEGLPAGQLPRGVRIERAAILEQLILQRKVPPEST